MLCLAQVYSSARGNTSLESAVSLTKSLRIEIQDLGQRLASAAAREDLRTTQAKLDNEVDLLKIIKHTQKLLTRIEDAVPLINLAITTSGASLSTSLPTSISPSRLLQASTFLTVGDGQYFMTPGRPVQVGPTFVLSAYMLFSGHIRPQNEDDIRQSTWKEVIHKAHFKILRVPLQSLEDLPQLESHRHVPETDPHARSRSNDFAYQILIVEDLEDDRVHTFEEDAASPGPFADVNLAGIREIIPIHQISKIFYADTGKILNIGSEGEINSPVLLLKRDPHAISPLSFLTADQRAAETPSENGQELEESARQDLIDAQLQREDGHESTTSHQNKWRFPPNLDPEWLAFEVYHEADSESDSDSVDIPLRSEAKGTLPSDIGDISQSKLLPQNSSPMKLSSDDHTRTDGMSSLPAIRTSLSLLETLLRLLSLQQFQQTSHLSIPDELLNFFLSETATTGAAQGDERERRRLRNEARQRVGFDPYDESPIKRRGENYQYQAGVDQGEWKTPEDDKYSPGSAVRYQHINSNSRLSETPESHLPLRFRSASRTSSPRATRGQVQSNGSPRTPSTKTFGRPKPMIEDDGSNVKTSSTLARPGTGLTDEGLGTSPASMKDT